MQTAHCAVQNALLPRLHYVLSENFNLVKIIVELEPPLYELSTLPAARIFDQLLSILKRYVVFETEHTPWAYLWVLSD